MKKISKYQSEKYLEDFFSNIKDKTPSQVKKMLKIAMSRNLKLQGRRKLFCKKCFTVFTAKNSKVRIKHGIKSVRCLNCSSISRWKIK